MKLRATHVVPMLVWGVASTTHAQTTESAVSKVVLKPDIAALSQDLTAAQALVVKRVQASQDPEEALAAQYAKLQDLCDAKFQALDSDAKRYAAAEARTNVIGSVLALIVLAPIQI